MQKTVLRSMAPNEFSESTLPVTVHGLLPVMVGVAVGVSPAALAMARRSPAFMSLNVAVDGDFN